MGQKLVDRRSLSWVSVQTAFEDADNQRIVSRREVDNVAVINDGVQLFDRVFDFVERRILVSQVVEDTAQRPNVRFPADLITKKKDQFKHTIKSIIKLN